MKKLLSIAVCASAVAAFATTNVTCGTVGVTAVTSSLTNTVVAVSFTDLASDGNITISNIVKTANLAVDDILYVFKGNSYESYVLKDHDGVKYWDTPQIYTQGVSGESVSESVAASVATLAVGQGLWLVRGPNWDGNEFTFYIYGKPANATTVSVSEGQNLIGNPTASAAVPKVDGATTGDQVRIPQNYTFPRTYTWTGTAWKYTNPETHIKVTTDSLPAIPAGTGFWYVAKGSATISF